MQMNQLDPAAMALLEPVLKARDIPKGQDGKPSRTWTTGQVMVTFFNYTASSAQPMLAAVGKETFPPAAKASGDAPGNRTWTLVDVERVAYAVFHSDQMKNYDAARLLRTLDVVYSVARLHGMIPPYVDPISHLRQAPPTPVRKTRQKRATRP